MITRYRNLTLLSALLLSCVVSASHCFAEPIAEATSLQKTTANQASKSEVTKKKPSAQEAMQKAIGSAIAAHRGVVTLSLEHLESGEVFQMDAERPMPSASMIKFPLMVTVYAAAARGEVDLDKKITLEEEDKVPGSGILTSHFTPGAVITLRDAIRLMMAWSDNTATNLVIDSVGIEACNQFMDQLGYPTTKLNSKVYRRDTTVSPERSEQFGLGSMSSYETVSLFKKLNSKDPFGVGVGKPYGKLDAKQIESYCEEMIEHLRSAKYGTVAKNLPADVKVAQKGGSVSQSRCEAGIIDSSVGTILFCVMTTENEDRSWGAENEAELLMGQIGETFYEYFALPDVVVAPRSVARVLTIGDDGALVESLQKTINARLKEGPRLGVDGDFGPNTEGGVKRFQESVGLAPTGKVDIETWKALGPLVMTDAPVASPSEVNAELLAREPQDLLTGPPVTTCAAWAIADGVTGEVLWDKEGNVVRDPASTTKMMTAYLVTCLSEKDPSILDEVITFTSYADNTTGSTAGVRAGEQVKVSDLLYGLMLPSGNDASVAFAQHFGDRFESELKIPYDRFIEAMNAKAKELGMDKTGYRNPHGLTAEGHVTCAEDLVKLAHAAMKNETFRKVVATRRYGVTLQSVDGYERNVIWNNTDRLLGFEGYYGVKTGTTGPAGACLVSAGTREGKDLIVVILGATNSNARYVDARNLYRWAWAELAR